MNTDPDRGGRNAMYLRKLKLAFGLLALTGLLTQVALAEGGHPAPPATATDQTGESAAADRYTFSAGQSTFGARVEVGAV